MFRILSISCFYFECCLRIFYRVIFCFVLYLCGAFNFHLFIMLYFIFYCLIVIMCFCILLCSYFVFISSFIISITCFDGPKAHIFLGPRRLIFGPSSGPFPSSYSGPQANKALPGPTTQKARSSVSPTKAQPQVHRSRE